MVEVIIKDEVIGDGRDFLGNLVVSTLGKTVTSEIKDKRLKLTLSVPKDGIYMEDFEELVRSMRTVAFCFERSK